MRCLSSKVLYKSTYFLPLPSWWLHLSAWLSQEWIAAKCPEFISKDEWPTNSPDLNPLGYHVWGAVLDLYQKYQPRPKNISEVKVTFQLIWNDLPRDPIVRSVLSFTKGLRLCIRADSEHSEYLLWLANCSLLLQHAACVKCQQNDYITALFYVVLVSNVLLLFVDAFHDLTRNYAVH